MKKTVALVGGLMMLVSGAVYAAATVPAGKETIKIDLIPGDKGGVEFPHAKHMTFKKPDGKAVECKDCHHTLKAATPAAGEKVVACNTCHQLDTPKTVEGKQAPVLAVVKNGKAPMNTVLFHKTCRDECHKATKIEGKNLTACNTCHKK